MRLNHRLSRLLHFGYGIGLCLFSTVGSGAASDQVDNWDMDGAHGTLSVQGALTESACRLAMSSAYQTISLGITGIGQLQREGQTGTPVAVQLRLEDCSSGESRSRDDFGNVVWSPDMPSVMKIRFLAPADSQNPRLIAVAGAKGIGLQLSDAVRQPITLGQYSAPQLVSSGQNQLTFYVTPVRTTENLEVGDYQTLVRFQLSYD